MKKLRLAPSVAILAGWLCTAFLILPFVSLLLHLSWRNIWSVWIESGGTPLFYSLWSTAISLCVTLLFGTPLGWYLARGQGILWKAIEILLLIPLLMPPLVIGLLLVYFYGPYGIMGHLLTHFGLSATNTILAVVLAQLYESVPYYVFAAQAAFSQIDIKFERISLSLGVSPWQTLRRVIFPLARPGLLIGFAMAFARAIGAFGAVIVVAYYPNTLPVSIWIALEEQGLPSALPLALLLILVALPLPLATVLWRRVHHD
ncbi:molybdate/tungstate transport system permease protein [Alicyclobacillus tolerans]|nr:molybdate/tungstate transport system permease protein [Alicyclobacillus montanus]